LRISTPPARSNEWIFSSAAARSWTRPVRDDRIKGLRFVKVFQGHLSKDAAGGSFRVDRRHEMTLVRESYGELAITATHVEDLGLWLRQMSSYEVPNIHPASGQ
jgi:hypothetical protein